jgi:hypothetical protein
MIGCATQIIIMEKIMRNTRDRRLLMAWMFAFLLAICATEASSQTGPINFHGELTVTSPGMPEGPGDPGGPGIPGLPGLPGIPSIPGIGLFSMFDDLDKGLSNGGPIGTTYSKYYLQCEFISGANESAFVDVLDYYMSYAPDTAKLVTVSLK